MAKTLLSGKSISIYIKDGGTPTYKLLVCNTEASLSHNVDEIDTSSKCDDGVKTILPGRSSWEMSFSGQVNTTPTSGSEYSWDDILGFAVGKTQKTFAFRDATSTDIYAEGDGYLTSVEIQANDNEVVTFSATITGTGALDVTP
jgi:hypothetical protein